MSAPGLSRDLGEIARRRASQGAVPAASRTRPGPAPPTDPAAPRIRSGIAALLRGERPAPAPVPPPAPDCGRELLDLPGAELLPGEHGAVLAVRRDVQELLPNGDVAAELHRALGLLRHAEPDSVHRGLQPAIGHDLSDLVVMDLETTGFWGCTIFLVGLLLQEEGRLVTRQLLARDYSEEARVLAAAARIVEKRKLLVSFNGKSYDVPCFRERAVYHRLRKSLPRIPHVDVLHPARRAFGGELPDCRLQTLEKHVVGIHRQGDVPSAEIPGVYHRFAATGRADELLPVLHHSRVDVVTTASLFARVVEREVSRGLAGPRNTTMSP